MSKDNFLEMLSQGILVGIILVGIILVGIILVERLGVGKVVLFEWDDGRQCPCGEGREDGSLLGLGSERST